MNSEDNALSAVGVDADDERIYRDLLRRPRAALPELAAHTGRTTVALRRAFSRLADHIADRTTFPLPVTS
ncbi:hypothetical protein ACWEPC_17625, partial [Nonomuraea sp. NPDC004297]